MTSPEWEVYLRGRFPGYLLPEAAATTLTVEAARRFLEAVSGRPDQLDVLRAASTLVSRAAALREFTCVSLPKLVRELPSHNESKRREWIGGFHGRLSVCETQFLHMQGRRTEFVTRSPRRTFDLPENLLVRAVCDRLLRAITVLHRARVLPESGWGLQLRDAEGRLRHTLASTPLGWLPIASVTPFLELAAASARHPTFHEAVGLWRVLRDGLDTEDPYRIAEVVRDGALFPLEDHTRFELAVAIRVIEAIESELSSTVPQRWQSKRSLIRGGRREIVSFTHGETTLRVYYNQPVLPAGQSDLGCSHYFGCAGRLRPDLTLTIERAGRIVQATVVEVKHSSDPGYLMSGYREAILYRWEYAPHLTGWPKAILVASGPIPGGVRTHDDVVAVSWDGWVPESMTRSFVAALCA